MDLEVRQTSDRNGKLYQVMHHGQIVGDADDAPTAEWLRGIIAAAFEYRGELTQAAREDVENALREVHLENVVNLFWP